MSEKKLTFIINSKPAETGAKKIKEGISGIQQAYNKAKKAAEALNDPISRSTIFLREQTKQQQGYYKALADTLTPQQKLTLYTKKQSTELNSLKMELDRVGSARSKEIAEVRDELNAKKQLDSLQRKLKNSYSEEYIEAVKLKKAIADRRKEILGLNNTMSDAEKAQQNLTKSLQFWEQREKDLDSAQYQKLIRLRESSRQLEAYQKSLVNALTPAQQLAKAENQLARDMQASEVQLKLYEKGIAQKAIAQRESLSIQKQLAQSEERLKQAYSEEYAQILKNNEALKKRRREILGLDDANSKLRKSNQTLSDSFQILGAAITGVSIGFIAADIARMADAYKGLQNRIAVVTGSTEGLTEVTRDLLGVARDSRVSLDAVADTYSKLSRVNKQFGLSQQELLKVTTTVSQAVSMSGATAQGAQGAMIQFAQALQNNFAAAAQEMNSIIEQTPGLAEAVADAMNAVEGVTTYSMGNIKRAATEGALDVESVLRGLLMVSEDYTRRFELSQILLSQGWVQVKNSLTTYIGELDKASGVTEAISRFMFDATEDVEGFGTALTAAASAFAGFSAVIAGAGLAKLVAILGVGGPILLGVTAIAAAIGTIVTKQALWSQKVEETEKAYNKLANAKDLALSDREIATVTSVVDTKSLDEVEEKIAFHVDRITEAQQKIKDLEQNPPSFFEGLLGEDVEDLEEKIGRSEKALGVLTTAMQLLRKETDKPQGESSTAKSLEEANKALDGMLDKLDPVRGAWAEYNKEIEKLNKLGGDQDKQIKVRQMLWQRLQETLEDTSKSVGLMSDAFKSFRSDLDPVYKVQQDFNKSMETLNKHVKEGTPLYQQLASVVKNEYTKALEEASKQTTIGLDGLKNKLRETTDYLSSRIKGGQATGTIDMEAISQGRVPEADKNFRDSFGIQAADFAAQLEKGLLGPESAAQMISHLQNYVTRLDLTGDGSSDIEGMRGAIQNLAAQAKDYFGTVDLSDLTESELAQVFKDAQEEAKRLEEEDRRIRTENNTYLRMLGDWAKIQLGDMDGMSEEERREKLKEAAEKDLVFKEWHKKIIEQDNTNLQTIADWATKQSGENGEGQTQTKVSFEITNKDGTKGSVELSGGNRDVDWLAKTLQGVSTSVGR